MPVFPKPTVPFEFDVKQEITALRAHKAKRQIPAKSADSLLVATWNIANLGAQAREERHYKLIAEIVSWFDIIAIQETRENLSGLRAILAQLARKYRTVFTDAAGNDERMAYIFDSTKVSTMELVGELALEPKDLKNIKLPGVAQPFEGFDRNPFQQSFSCGKFKFTLTNAHNYFGDDSGEKLQRRQLETFALASWAKRMAVSPDAYNENLILLGDFNLPLMQEDDPIYSIFKKHGLLATEHATQIGTTISGESSATVKEIYHYDQVMFFPKTAAFYTGVTGVVDYDSAIFRELWETKTKVSEFTGYLRYYISDHRPLWAKFRC